MTRAGTYEPSLGKTRVRQSLAAARGRAHTTEEKERINELDRVANKAPFSMMVDVDNSLLAFVSLYRTDNPNKPLTFYTVEEINFTIKLMQYAREQLAKRAEQACRSETAPSSSQEEVIAEYPSGRVSLPGVLLSGRKRKRKKAFNRPQKDR